MNKSLDILQKYWGFSSFRLGQEDIINDVLYGHDTLALLPTGGGKSICFQVPGISREGITIVISPLIALMQDQVKSLESKGIRAKALVSGMSFREIDITLDNARFGAIDFLYTSPERLQSSLFIERFKLMNVGLIVVDEAHCISEWGHDFRPAFKNISNLRNYHPEVPIIALTATATNRTKLDIITQLGLKNVKVHQSKFERENLTYNSYKVENKLKSILNYCQTQPGTTGIVYCQTRRSVKAVAKLLHSQSIKVGIYHGGMNSEDRKLMLNDWLTDKIDIMVATNAFGMGIDKPDVRYVLHYEFPQSLEAYFQEAGRAGRDGKKSVAINYFEEQDIPLLQRKVNNSFPDVSTIKATYRALCNFLQIAIGSGNNETYNLDIRKFCSTFQLDIVATYNALKFLELNGELVFSEGVFHPTKVKFTIGNTALYNFQIKHDNVSGLITLLSRSYSGIFDQYQEIHETEFCKRLKITNTQLEQHLKYLEQYGVLDISWKSSLPTVTLLHERLPDDYLEIKPEVYQLRKQLAYDKLESCIAYMTEEKCRSQQLIEYFNISSEPCGKCDVCTENKLSDLEMRAHIIAQLTLSPMSINELTNKIGVSDLKLILRDLILQEKVALIDDKYHLV